MIILPNPFILVSPGLGFAKATPDRSGAERPVETLDEEIAAVQAQLDRAYHRARGESAEHVAAIRRIEDDCLGNLLRQRWGHR